MRPVIAVGNSLIQWRLSLGAHDSTTRCSTYAVGGLISDSSDENTPASAVERIDRIDLEAHSRVPQRVQLRTRAGTKDHDFTVEYVVHGYDERTALVDC